MKKIIATLCLCFSGVASAELVLIPQCFGSAHVAQEEPYILTLNNANPAYLNRMISDLTNSGLVVVNDLMDFDSSQVLMLSVDSHKAMVRLSSQSKSASTVNRAVAQKVRATFRKYKTKYYLECNGNIIG